MARRNAELSRMLTDARAQLEDMREKIRDLSAPPQTFGTFVGWHAEHADVHVGGRRLRVAVLPDIPRTLEPGTDVLLNALNVVVGVADVERTGQAAIVREVLDDERVLVVARGEDERVVTLVGGKALHRVREGDTVVIDPRSHYASEKIERTGVESLLLEEVPDVHYSDIGGLDSEIERIRDAVELPLRHAELFTQHRLKPPRGLLLYGPPGCGKTLLAKAVARSLADVAGASTSHFLSVKGPELLNKYVGETERYIRTIFERARSKAEAGSPVVVFFDEMDALFRSRGSGVSSDMETTVVPQLLTELDGVEELSHVLVIGASNREDMIDPAIVRPGRLDVKIEIGRPDRDAVVDIMGIYLTHDVPLAAADLDAADSAEHAARAMATECARFLFDEADGSQYVSGAMVRSIVDRAKTSAIKAAIAGDSPGISTEFLREATRAEVAEARAVAGTSLSA